MTENDRKNPNLQVSILFLIHDSNGPIIISMVHFLAEFYYMKIMEGQHRFINKEKRFFNLILIY